MSDLARRAAIERERTARTVARRNGAVSMGATLVLMSFIVVQGGYRAPAGPGAPPDAGGGSVSALLADGFESGDLTCGSCTGDSVSSFSWGGGGNAAVSSTNPRTGTYALRLTFPVTQTNNLAEQNFDLGDEYSELWVEWYEHIPSNYAHNDSSPAPNNNKHAYLADTKDEGATGYHVRSLLESWQDTVSGVTGFDRGRPMWGTNDSRGGLASSGNGMAEYDTLTLVTDTSTWVRWQWHVSVATDTATADGVWKLCKNGSLRINETGLDNAPTDNGAHGYQVGYFRGAANGGYLVQTVIDIDDVKFYAADPGWDCEV